MTSQGSLKERVSFRWVLRESYVLEAKQGNPRPRAVRTGNIEVDRAVRIMEM